MFVLCLFAFFSSAVLKVVLNWKFLHFRAHDCQTVVVNATDSCDVKYNYSRTTNITFVTAEKKKKKSHHCALALAAL